MVPCALLAGVWKERQNGKDLCCLVLFISSVVAQGGSAALDPSAPFPSSSLLPPEPSRAFLAVQKQGRWQKGSSGHNHPEFTVLWCPTRRAPTGGCGYQPKLCFPHPYSCFKHQEFLILTTGISLVMQVSSWEKPNRNPGLQQLLFCSQIPIPIPGHEERPSKVLSWLSWSLQTLLSSTCPRIYGGFAVVQQEETITLLQIKPENSRNHSCQ